MSEEQSPELNSIEEQPSEKATTIKLPSSLKDELDTLKQDNQETYAGVIVRLIAGMAPVESDPETVTVSLPRRVYHMALMLLPGNIADVIRKGVR
jgi:hypothetical protein